MWNFKIKNMSNIDKKMNEIKYVDLNGLKVFAEELKSYLQNHILEFSIYNELKDIIENAGGGADWNAIEGENGYIKNKPFRFIDVEGNEYKFTNPLKKEDFIPEIDENGEIYKYKKSIDANDLQYVVCNKKMTSYGYLYDTEYYPVKRTGNRFHVDFSEYGGYVYITEEMNEEAGYYNYWLVVEVTMPNMFFPENTVYIIDNYENEVEYVTASVNIDIPDTVVKTTPQNLSSTAKNQVKENLGISDPPTPDWNAQQGKEGYIKNKPFGIITQMTQSSIKIEDNINYEDGTGVIKFKYTDDFRILQQSNLGSATIIYNDCSESNYIILWNSDYMMPEEYLSFKRKYNENNYYVLEYEIGHTYESDDALRDQISKALKTLTYVYDDGSEGFTKIPQSMVNMPYIDPVVWKYLCNPFMLIYDYTISDEVHNMIWYEEASTLRSVILNTAQVFYNGQPHKINKLISTNRLGIITSDGEVIYEYDAKIKQFKIVE